MNLEEIIKTIKRLEYHQSLLLKMNTSSSEEFYKLVIVKNLEEDDVIHFHEVCDKLNKKLEEQKAEGFVYFHPLFNEFKLSLHSRLKVEEVISACLKQGLHLPLMTELRKYL